MARGQEGELGLMGPDQVQQGLPWLARGPQERPAGWGWPAQE